MSYQFRTLIVAANVVDNVRLVASTWAECDGILGRPLTANGSTVTHYISSGYFTNSVCNLLGYEIYQPVYDPETETTTVELVDGKEYDIQAIVDQAIEEGLNPGQTAAEVQIWSAQADCSNQTPEAAMARLGLAFMPEDEII